MDPSVATSAATSAATSRSELAMPLASDLTALADQIQAIVGDVQTDSLSLLALLRLLEQQHRAICETYFQPSLPNTRQALYTLLRDIESEGGWPHIPRMKLQAIMQEFLLAEAAIEDESAPTAD